MFDSANSLTRPDLMSDATVAEHTLPREWRDRLYGEVVAQPLFVVAILELVFGRDWEGSNEPGDLVRERTKMIGAAGEKAVNDVAWSTAVRAAWRDGTPGRDRIFVVIEAQSTVDRGMPFRVMQYEGMRARLLQDRGQYPVPRIRTVVLYTEEKPWDARLDAGESFADLMVESRPRVVYELVALHCLDAEPGTRNLVRLLTGVVRGDTPESLARAAGSSTERIAELGDGRLERSLFTLVQAQGNEKRREFDCYRCGNLAGLLRRLEENEMTWPEKWIEQMRPQFEERIRREFEPKLRQEVEVKLRAELEAELRAKLEAELELKLRRKVEAELELKLRPEVEAELAEELRPEVEAEVAEELRQDAERELERKLRPRVKEKPRDELREAHREQ